MLESSLRDKIRMTAQVTGSSKTAGISHTQTTAVREIAVQSHSYEKSPATIFGTEYLALVLFEGKTSISEPSTFILLRFTSASLM